MNNITKVSFNTKGKRRLSLKAKWELLNKTALKQLLAMNLPELN